MTSRQSSWHDIRRLGRSLLLAAGMAGAAAWAAPQAPEPPEPAWVYRIQPGDNLFDLSASYLADSSRWRELQRINKVADPLRLTPGSELRLPIRLLRREAAVAQAAFVQGEVSLLRATTAATPLTTGAELRSGDLVRTGEQASATLRFVDGSRLLLAPNSEVAIEQLLVYGRSAIPAMQLRLQKGSADSKVQKAPQRPPDYELKTPSLNLGVRGTEFRVQLAEDGQTTRAEVLEGVVAAHTTKVEAGFGVLASTSDPQPRLARLAATPDLSAVPPRLERIPLTLAWAAVPGASAYRAQVFAAGDFDRLLLDGRFTAPRASWADLPDGRYSLRVRTIDALGLEGLASDVNFVLKARPEPPFSRAPMADATIYGDSVDLAWTKPAHALGYRLQISSDEAFSAPLLDRSDLGTTDTRVDLPPGRYHWRLASIAAAADQGPFGDAQTFTVKPIPPAPPLSPPAIGADELQFRWAAAPGAARYQLQWASDAEFKQLLAEPQADRPELLLPRPPAGVYYLRVRSVDAAGYAGPFGSAQQVEIPRSRWYWLLPLAVLLLLKI